jgi:hypothetical protein
MLVQPDIRELGDFRLDPKESVAREREKALAMAARKRIYKQGELEDAQRALGPRIHFEEMIRRLRKLIPSLKVLDGSPGNVALYVPRDTGEVAARYYEWLQEQEEASARGRKRQDFFFLYHKYVGGFPKLELQEYTTIDIDNANLGTKEHRSWRTVLIGLLRQGVLSYKEVVSEFRDIGTDRRGWRWNDSTRKWRNYPSIRFSEQKEN